MFNLLRDLSWPVGILVVVICGFILSFLLLLVTRRVRDPEVTHHTQVITMLLTFTTLVFGVQVSYVIVLEQQWLNNGRANVINEAGYLAILLRNANTYPPEEKVLIKEALAKYIHYVIDEEWPEIQQGQTFFPKGEELVSQLWQVYESFDIQGEKEHVLYDHSLYDLANFAHARSQRLALSYSTVHPLLWTWIVLLGFTAIFLAALLPVKEFTLNLFLNSFYTTIILMVLYITFTLEHPYRGQIRVEANEFTRLEKLYDLIH